MTLQDLKLRLQKNTAFKSELKNFDGDKESMDESEKTQATVSVEEEEDNTSVEQDPGMDSSNHHHEEVPTPPSTPRTPRTPRRSSLSSINKYEYNTFDEEGEVPPPSTPQTPRRHSSISTSTSIGTTPRRSSLKGSNGTPKGARRHSLTFSRDVVVATIVPTPELAKKKSLWFMEKDYEKMRKKISHIANKAQEKGGAGHKYCTRGLENLIRQGSETRRYAAWDAVLDEQENQTFQGAGKDEDALSQSYRSACEESRAEATIRALQDEKEVAEYLSETRNYCRRSSM
ncbi:unnamed protein product [Cylindrotheca closterium]|uniref:Uncharacterized protein n=1 Tax=Cylindrotheca closterium TaxID=2856 RepID=A0AAD2FZG0_9STRA|nr:unnamed protein product [Cylindrotheca closterium]